MSFEKSTTDNALVETSKDKKVLYTLDFEQLLSPSNIKNALRMTQALEEAGEVGSQEEKDGLSVTFLGSKIPKEELREELRDFNRHYFNVKIGDSSFFVKHSHPSIVGGGGYKEAQSNLAAQKILQEKGIDWAEVIEFKLGYSDKSRAYFISDWQASEHSMRLDAYLETLKETIDTQSSHPKDSALQEKYNRINERLVILNEVLKSYYDIRSSNIFIDANSEKLYLFDLYDLNL